MPNTSLKSEMGPLPNLEHLGGAKLLYRGAEFKASVGAAVGVNCKAPFSSLPYFRGYAETLESFLETCSPDLTTNSEFRLFRIF